MLSGPNVKKPSINNQGDYQLFEDPAIFHTVRPPSIQNLQYQMTTPQSSSQPITGLDQKEGSREQRKELTLEELIQRSAEDAQAMTKKLKDIIQKSTLSDRDPMRQADKVVEEFNRKQKASGHNIISVATVRNGYRIEPNQFILAHRNKVPELAHGRNGERLQVDWTGPRTESGLLGIINQNEPFFGAHGSYVINVPRGKFAKAWTGSDSHPIIFDEGVHVIHDSSFKFDINDRLTARAPIFDPSTVFVNQADPYVDHGTLHILRVPQGKLAKVIVNGKPELLEPHDEPYVFNTANFQFNRNTDLISQSELYIAHQNLHILRVQPGKYAKVYNNGIPELLEPRDKPYVYDTPRFTFNPATDFVLQSERYIQHGTIHIISVSMGYIAKVWIGSEARLLEHNIQPYKFNDPFFRLEPESKDNLFVRADAELITHGSIKQIIPPLNKVAVTNNEGNLEIISKKTTITSATHKHITFLDTSVQTLDFPSENTRKLRQRENKDASSDEINYEVFTTSDSLKVGVKLLVAYRISDPEKTCKKLGYENIVTHIECVVTADMGKAIQSCTSQEFLTSYQNKPGARDDKQDRSSDFPSAPRPQTYQDIVKDQLALDLEEYGITLIRMNVEESKILNGSIAAKMEEQALVTAKARAEIAVLQQNNQIAESKAVQEAQVRKIATNQDNSARIAAAQAQAAAAQEVAQGTLNAAKINAEASMVEAEARNKIALMEAETRNKVAIMEGETRNKIAKAQGEQYNAAPALVAIEIAKLSKEALSNFKTATFNVTSQEFSSLCPGLSFFGQKPVLSLPPVRDHKEDSQPASLPIPGGGK